MTFRSLLPEEQRSLAWKMIDYLSSIPNPITFRGDSSRLSKFESSPLASNIYSPSFEAGVTLFKRTILSLLLQAAITNEEIIQDFEFLLPLAGDITIQVYSP